MNETNKKKLSEKIQNKKVVYSCPESINERFDDENAYKEQYSNRVVLEIIQNAEDAEASLLSFEYDEKNNILSVFNDGCNFEPEGYFNLLFKRQSTKKNGCFIGQKGLGFRSIINWASEINIISDSVCVSFSDEYSQKFLNDLKKQHINDSDWQNLENMEFFSVPEVDFNYSDTFQGTKLIIKCRNNIKSRIIEELNNIDDECFYFLKNLKKIITPNKEYADNMNDSIIQVSKTDDLPIEYYSENEKRKDIKYNVALVWNPNKNYKDKPLYCYFRTSKKIGTPFLIHAGFELSDNRNNIKTDSNLNSFLIKQICLLIEQLIDKIIKNFPESWEAYKILSTEINTGMEFLFEPISNKIEELYYNKPIFPCIDGKMRSYNEVSFLPDQLIDFIVELKNNCAIQGYSNVVVQNSYSFNIDNGTIASIINKLSSDILKLDEEQQTEYRAKLIKLSFDLFNNWTIQNNPISIFTDENDKLVNFNDEIYIPKNIDITYFPNYINIRFLNKKLLRCLKNNKIIQSEYELNSFLQNLKYIDSDELFKKLLYFQQIPENEDKRKMLLKCIFEFSKQEGRLIEKDCIFIPTVKNNFCNTNLIFDKTYFSCENKIYNILFNFIKQTENIIVSKDYWKFLNCNDEELLTFLKKVGVSEFPSVQTLEDNAVKLTEILSPKDLICLTIEHKELKAHFKINENSNLLKKIKDIEEIQDYVIEPKKGFSFINNGKINLNEIYGKYIKSDVDDVLLLFGAKKNWNEISDKRLDYIVTNLENFDKSGKSSRQLYDLFFERELTIHYPQKYFSKPIEKEEGEWVNYKELYYYDNKCLPESQLHNFPTINLGLRKGVIQVAKCFKIKPLNKDNYPIQLIGKPDKNEKLTKEFKDNFEQFKSLILAYRFLDIKESKTDKEDLTEKSMLEALQAINALNVLICNNLSYEIKYSFGKYKNTKQIQNLDKDFDFINIDNNYYLKIPNNCKSLNDIRYNNNYAIKFYNFLSEMLFMQFNVLKSNAIKEIIPNSFIMNNIQFSEEKFSEENENYQLLILAKEKLNQTDFEYEFWHFIWEIKKTEQPYEKWIKTCTTKIYNTDLKDYRVYNSETWDWIFDEKNMNIPIDEFFSKYKIPIDFKQNNEILIHKEYEKIKIILDKYIWYRCKEKKEYHRFIDRKNRLDYQYNYYKINIPNVWKIDAENIIWAMLKKEHNYTDKQKIYDVANDIPESILQIQDEYLSVFNQNELDIIEQNNEHKSLLHYTGFTEQLKDIIKNNSEKSNLEEKYDNLQNEIKNIKTEEVDIQTLKIFSKKQTENKKERHYKTGANTRKCRENDLNARINGKKAEEAVKNHLRNNNNCRFELIEDKSSMICGYDLQCRDKETDNTIYMEVKCVNSGVFNLTKNEYETLFNPIYRQIYYFAFVEFDADKANISFVEGNKYKKEDFEIDSFICNNIVKNE